MLVVAGETIVDLIEIPGQQGQYQAFTGGGPYNVAKATAKMNIDTGYLSPVSTDLFGDDFANEMQQLNIVALSPRSDAPSGLAIVRSDETGHPTYCFYRDHSADRDIDEVRLADAMPKDARAFYVGGLALADGDDADVWTNFASTVTCPVFVDPNIRPSFIKNRSEFLSRLARIYDAAHILKLSDEDIQWLAPDHDPQEYILEIMNKHNISLGLLTMGSKGAHALTKDDEVFSAAPKVEVVDTVGAGDCFSAACLASLLRHESVIGVPTRVVLTDTLNYAVTAAAINCMRAGANAPTHDEITHALSNSTAKP